MTWDVPANRSYLPDPLVDEVARGHRPVPGVAGLTVDPTLLDGFPDFHAREPMQAVVDVARTVQRSLNAVLDARIADRAFVDARTLELRPGNVGVPVLDPAYRTPIGARDPSGRVVVGPLDDAPARRPVTLPAVLQGPTVTLFGPPDDARMCVNAMNAAHRRRPDEPALVAELVDGSGVVPRWGADSEDSKTPFPADLLAATANLARCADGTLEHTDPRTGKHYALAPDRRSIPIKRVPGLALPDASHLLDGRPLPLHLVDLVLHAWKNAGRPEALSFYVPKLENEEEAAYVAELVRATEARLGIPHGTIRLFVVFETPRAIFRIAEMADALHPWFAGGSLGWHDFLASTARLFRHDPGYRIPVKADPNIVIHHIRESHRRLVDALTPIGAVRIGGMYGTLFEDGNDASFQVSMVGYVKDVVTQLRRGLDGFWVAHPDFVRIGIALVEAWRRGPPVLDALVAGLVTDPDELAGLRAFLARPDAHGLDASDPLYPRRVLAADLIRSDVIENHDPREVRYNVFQALQYLAAWLSGTGCVALPAALKDARGTPVFVRVMDDLATTERSRWELWAEVAHGRVPVADFDRILSDTLAFIQAGVDSATERVQVRWEGEPARWYPVAGRLLRQLVVEPDPVEAVTELLLPFTLPVVRDASDPWARARELCPGRYAP